MSKKIEKIKKLKKMRLHHEGVDTLVWSAIFIAAVALLLWRLEWHVPFWVFVVLFGAVYCVLVNFFRCPIRRFPSENTDNLVVAPADGRIVVIEKVDENEYFHEPRLMISIFMSLFNVHANWFPVDGKVLEVHHFNGDYHKAWLPKAAAENEHADIIIEMEHGVKVLCRQIAGAVARRIVTYAKEEEECFIDEHLGFIKFGSRVDVFLPVDAEVCVKMGQSTTGDQTVLAKLK